MLFRSFRNILIPVDFSINTDVAITKCLEIIDSEKACIHLLHVKNSAASESSLQGPTADEKLNQWKDSIEDYLPTITVECSIEEASSVENSIVKKAKELMVDLIVIGKNSRHKWLPFFNTVSPSKLAEQAGVPLLTVKPGALHNKLRTLVVPVTNSFGQSKLTAIELLSKKAMLNIHLVTFAGDQDEPAGLSSSSLLQAYQWLRTHVRCTVEYSVLPGNNRVRSIIGYAEKVNADILLLYPHSETKIGWWNTHISDVLPSASRVQVLTVQPSVSII